jgi:hypothetical protein
MKKESKMAAYMISYDLMAPGKDYSSLTKAITTKWSTNWNVLRSQWIISPNANDTAVSIREYLTPYMDSNDKLLVTNLSGEASWRNLGDASSSDWLKKYL